MIQLADFGSFYIGGREISIENAPLKTVWRNPKVKLNIDPNGHYTIESMYVDYYIPEHAKGNCVLIHGGGHTGAVWDKTPDGRQGWLQLLLQQQYCVYVVDTVERGRSGWCSLPDIWSGEPEQRTQEVTWHAFRIGRLEDFKDKKPYPHQQFPTEYFYQLTQYDVPRWNCNAKVSAANLALLLQKIGPSYLIAHSQGADVAMQAYEKVPPLVKGITLLEPAAFPDIKAKAEAHIEIRFILGDYLSLVSLWRELQDLTFIYAEKLSQSGLTCKVINLPELGILGNSHMLMMDRNNQTVLEISLPSYAKK